MCVKIISEKKSHFGGMEMLISLAVKNFLSFKNQVELNLVASNRITESKGNLITLDDETQLLKSAVVFGPNASGKTNLLVAVKHIQKMIINSFKQTQEGEELPVTPFVLNENSRQAPTEFQIKFIEDDILFDYKIVVTSKEVVEEYLSVDGQQVFKRVDKEIEIIDNDFVSNENLEKRQDFVRDNSLFVSVLAATNLVELKPFMNFFTENLNMFSAAHEMPQIYTTEIIKDEKKREIILHALKKADLSIQDLSTKKFVPIIPESIQESMPDEILNKMKEGQIELQTEHNVYSDDGSIVDRTSVIANAFESSGTNSFLAFIGPIVDSLVEGKVLFIDEMDALFHPLMTDFVVELINGTNNNDAQIIFTSHNTHHLNSNLFRRDQIWFVEKDNLEISHLTALLEFKRRKDENFEINYLKGNYGAIPVIKQYEDSVFDHE